MIWPSDPHAGTAYSVFQICGLYDAAGRFHDWPETLGSSGMAPMSHDLLVNIAILARSFWTSFKSLSPWMSVRVFAR